MNRIFSSRVMRLCVLVGAAGMGCLDREPEPEPGLTVRQITFGPKHHFFGYIGHAGTVPWNRSGRYIVALRTDFQDRLPEPHEAADVILIDTERDYSVRVVDRTRAWNFQQGTMLYWNPYAPETQFFFNDRDPDTNQVFCVLFDISRGENGERVREYRDPPSPVGNSGVSQRGGHFLAINYGRLARLRPVTGYPGAHDWTVGTRHPADDGVFRIDVETGKKDLIVSFERLRDIIRERRPDVEEMELFINHTLWNRDGDRIFFFARAEFDDRDRRINISFIVRPDGSDVTLLEHHIGGHPEWEEGSRMIGRQGPDQVVYDTESQDFVETLGDPSIFPNPEGDIALSPDGSCLVNGYRREGHNFYVFYRRSDGRVLRSAGFDQHGWVSGPLRNDPTPCWNRDGSQVLFPSIAEDAEKTRQLFLFHLPADL